MFFAKKSSPVQCCLVTADLYRQGIFKGVLAVPQACCQPVLDSSIEQWGIHFVKSCAAVHWCWVTADLYGQGTFKVV